MNSLAQIISKRKHLLKRAGQLRQVLEPVTASAELGPSERLRSRADPVNSVAFSTIKPRRVRASRDVTAAPEILEGLAMTGTAHLERHACIRLCDEMTSVRFGLFRLRRIAAVATIAPDARAAVRAGLVDCNNPAGFVFLPTMAIDAVIVALGGYRGRSTKERRASQQ